ncbi:5-formyltetrahydrofolate cyclo-ligase [Thermanaeromonas sp. C210]|uniref:5-formyltetrahydrofolate cyclo-ligase n=1 Tax=Thermanaeromonas sp. C210 TaxID=2731925 RepID=UPI00155B67A9|nr:5-formyltetrahydrofolate cyclo-ligase [Thermanaeromonas sp. C210]GFN22052.1 5-formyltetrahydrofolate cyclo-ligase [Thermanaeromonas sp. C210]
MKKELRREILTRRDSLPADAVARKSQAIQERLVRLLSWQEARMVMLYVSFGSEVKTGELLQEALRQGKRVAVPYCHREKRELIASEVYRYPEDLSPGTWGIMEPRRDTLRPVKPQAIDLCIVPGVAFDEEGNRLGYGAGYYDRFLPHLRPGTPKIALAYDLQIVASTHPSPYDIPVDLIITETRIIKPVHRRGYHNIVP